MVWQAYGSCFACSLIINGPLKSHRIHGKYIEYSFLDVRDSNHYPILEGGKEEQGQGFALDVVGYCAKLCLLYSGCHLVKDLSGYWGIDDPEDDCLCLDGFYGNVPVEIGNEF